MKKTVLLSILLLVIVVSASAQYSSVYIPPKNEPTPKPIAMRTIAQLPPQEDCQTMCKRVTTERTGMNIELFVQCMHDRCKEDCESACRMMYGSRAMDCIAKFCERPEQPASCEEKCDETYKICNQALHLTKPNCEADRQQCWNDCRPAQTCEEKCHSIRIACDEGKLVFVKTPPSCDVLEKECIQRDCGPPQTCEQGCALKRDECLKLAVGISIEGLRAGCEKVHLGCLQDECGKPEEPKCPPPHECENKCVGGYYTCAKIARTMTAPAGKPEDVQEEYLRRCRLGIAECLDECAPELPPEYTCPERCRMVEKECLDAGIDTESCSMKAKDCMMQCYPRKPVVTQPPEKPECRELCARRHKECLNNGVEPMKCDEDLKYCAGLCEAPPAPVSAPAARMPSPEEMRGLNPQPEPPSWFARLMGLFRGG